MGFPWGDIVGQCGSLRREVLEPVYGCRLIVERGEPDNMLRVLPLPERHG